MLRSIGVYFCVFLGVVYCGSDLCENGAQIDSITYVNNKNTWFFTSGGHYWYLKEKDFPPSMPGTALPGGFEKGDAAIYMNYKDNCADIKPVEGPKPEEQEIHVTELVNGQNQILVFNTKTGEWLNGGKPIAFHTNKDISQAKVSRTLPIDAAFVHKKTNIVVIQGLTYSVVDIKNVCSHPNGFGTGKQRLITTDLNVVSPVDATAEKSDKLFYLFQDQIYFEVTIKSFNESNERLETTKDVQRDTIEFFKLNSSCKPPPKNQTIATTTQSQTDTQPPQSVSSEKEPISTESQSKNEKKGFPWIIVIIIIVIIVLIAIVLIACMIMRKSDVKTGDKENGAENETGSRSTIGPTSTKRSTSKLGSNLGSNLGSKPGINPSKKSTREGIGGVSEPVLNLGPSVNSKSSEGANSIREDTINKGRPSTMSVRSNSGVAQSENKSRKRRK